MAGWTYILECADRTYYVGSTNNLNRRIKEHVVGKGCAYTSVRLPIKLRYAKRFDTVEEAFRYEHQIKKWSRAKKEALIENRVEALIKLAKKNFK